MSHRTSSEEDLLRWGNNALATGVAYSYNVTADVMKVNQKISAIEIAGKEIFLDGAKVRPKEHYGP